MTARAVCPAPAEDRPLLRRWHRDQPDRVRKLMHAIDLLGRVARISKAVGGAAEIAGYEAAARKLSAIGELGANHYRVVEGWEHYQAAHVKTIAEHKVHYRSKDATCWTLALVAGVPVAWSDSHADGWVLCPVSREALYVLIGNEGPARIDPCDSHAGYAHAPDARRPPPHRTPEVDRVITQTLAAEGARAWLLWGPPGGGKTTAAYQIADAIGEGSWLTVSAQMQRHERVWDLVHALAPRALILDDFDTACSGPSECTSIALAGLERAREHAKVIILTANTLDQIRGALLRPGRVDESPVCVTSPTREIAAEILGDVPEDVVDAAHAAGLLGSYLAELGTRIRAGRDPEQELAELTQRMEMVGDR